MAYGFKYKKTSGRSSGSHPYTRENMKHISWCAKHGIKIAIIPHWEGDVDDWRIELNINKKIHLDPKVYEPDEAHVKMYEYAKYYYDKYKK